MHDQHTSGDAPAFGLIAATFTAFGADGSLNLDAIERQADDLARQGLRGAFVCGTTGESASLTTAERMAVAARWAEVLGPGAGLELIVHVGHASLDDARALAAHAERIGAAGIAAAPPSYFRPATVAAVVDCAARVAAAAPNTPFSYYHIPSMTGVAVPMAEVLPAAVAAIPNFAGIKFTYENMADFVRTQELAEGRVEMFFGRDEMLLAALAMGARAAVGTTYNVAAPLFRRLIAAFDRGDLAEARRWQAAAIRMVEAAVAHGGIPAFKAMSGWAGADCGPCRLPLATLDAAQEASLRSALEQAGFFAALAEAEAEAGVAPAR